VALSIPAGFLKRFATAHYALAALAVAAAVGLRLAFDPVLGAQSPYLPFLAAVLVAGRLGGRGPALASTVLSCFSVRYFFLEPRYSFALPQPAAATGLGLFAMVAIAISLLDRPGGLLPRKAAGERWPEADPDPVGPPMLRRVAMFTAAALAIGILASWLWRGFEHSTVAERGVEHSYQVLNAAASARSSLERAQTSQRGYLLTGDDQYIEAYRSAVASERQARAALRRLTADDHAQQARLDEYDRLMQTRLDMLANSIEVRKQQGMAAVAGLIRTNRGGKLMDRLRAVLDAVDDEEHRLLHSRTVAASQADSRTRWILGLGGGSLVLLLVLAGARIERHIYERAQVERVLARQARLIDLSQDAIVTAGGNRVITGWNSGAQQMYGWTEEQAIGRNIDELLHTSSAIPIAELDRILAREGRWNGELGHTRPDGRQIVAESWQVLQRDAAGRPAGYLEIDRDITERKRTEEALRLSEEKFAKAFATNPAAVAITRLADGLFLDVNESWEAMTGHTRGEAIGRSATDLSIWPTPEERDRFARELKQKGFLHGWEQTFARRSGESFATLLSAAILTVAGEEVVLSTLVDISDRKKAEEQIRRLNAELEQRVHERTAQLEASNKELEAFAYSVSHDLRAPLRGIDGWSLALIEDYGPALEPRAREYLGRVRSETQRMGRLIDDLLQLSRFARAQMHHDTVNLSLIAESIAAGLRETHPQRSLEFAIRPGLTAFGDARLLEVALTNLLENAVKFTASRAHARIEFETAGAGGNTAFVVRDNGVGFDMAYAGMLFGAFQRLHSEAEFPGTGIGLATVQRVIHRHGGRIWAEAEPDRGAAFYFTLGDGK